MARLVKVLLVLGVLSFLAFLGLVRAKKELDSYFNRGSVVTPTLVGKTLDEALEVANLPVKIASRVSSAEVPAGRILAQDPAPGTPVHATKPILVVLSSGANLVEVPNVLGQPLRKAKLALSDAHLGTGQICSMPSEHARDTILAQYPPPGGKLGKSGLVDVLVSVGPAALPSLVPRVVGMTETTARAALQNLGFSKVETVLRAPPRGSSLGTVIEQEPPPGTAAPGGTPLVLSIASLSAGAPGPRPSGAAGPVPPGPEPGSELKRVTFEFQMPPGLTPKRLDVFQSGDGKQRREIYSREHQPGEKVLIPAEGKPNEVLEFLVDNVAYGREIF